MSQTHTWFATSNDMALILEWLRKSHVEIVGISSFPTELPVDGRELIWV